MGKETSWYEQQTPYKLQVGSVSFVFFCFACFFFISNPYLASILLKRLEKIPI